MIEVYACPPPATPHTTSRPACVTDVLVCATRSICNDRLGKKIRVKCNPDDTIGDLKKLLAAQTGTRPEKLRIQKWYTVYKDHITLDDYEIHDGMGLELYCARRQSSSLRAHSSIFFCVRARAARPTPAPTATAFKSHR